MTARGVDDRIRITVKTYLDPVGTYWDPVGAYWESVGDYWDPVGASWDLCWNVIEQVEIERCIDIVTAGAGSPRMSR